MFYDKFISFKDGIQKKVENQQIDNVTDGLIMGAFRNFKAVMHLYVRGIDFISVSMIFQLDFGTVPTMWYFLDVYFIVLLNYMLHCIIK